MNRADRANLSKLHDDANALMDAPPQANATIRNIDVIEALIDDVGRMSAGKAPTHVAELLARDLADRAARARNG